MQPLEPLILADEAEVPLTVETESTVSVDDILQRAMRVYQGLTPDEIAHVENIALSRQPFFREPAA